MRYSPKEADEIQGRLAALDDIHDCVVMIYQACGLDRKKHLLSQVLFSVKGLRKGYKNISG